MSAKPQSEMNLAGETEINLSIVRIRRASISIPERFSGGVG